jgi:hypothetical protein
VPLTLIRPWVSVALAAGAVNAPMGA